MGTLSGLISAARGIGVFPQTGKKRTKAVSFGRWFFSTQAILIDVARGSIHISVNLGPHTLDMNLKHCFMCRFQNKLFCSRSNCFCSAR